MQDDKKLGTLSAGEVRSLRRLSDDKKIRDIFRYKFWDAEEAASYLVGFYDINSLDDNNDEFILLDGRSLKDPDDSDEIEEIWGRYRRLLRVWKKSGLKGRHRPATYIKLGFRDRDLCDIFWLGDVVQQRLLGSETERILPIAVGVVDDVPKVSESADLPEVKKEISHSQRQVLLKMIKGLIAVSYGKTDVPRGFKEEIKKDLERKGFSFAPGTFYKHLNAALEIEVPSVGGGEKSAEGESR